MKNRTAGHIEKIDRMSGGDVSREKGCPTFCEASLELCLKFTQSYLIKFPY